MNRAVVKSIPDTEAIRERLRVVADQHSQAEVARRTGVSKANVHRYLRAGKVPADFVAALAREFGVSAAWLLQGTGAMLASQVTQAAADEAARLLEVVVKLNAVGHEKLANLQKDASSRMVRELADALARHEQLRGKLATRSRPLFIKLLNEARDALAATDAREAAVALGSAAQLERIVNEPQLTAARCMLQGTLATLTGDLASQRRHHLVALGALIQAGRLRDRQFLRTAYNFCVGLIRAGGLAEAANTADAVLLLSAPETPEWDEDWLLQVPRAVLLMNTGRLIDAMPILSRVVAGCGDEVRPYAEDVLLSAHFLAGAAPRAAENVMPGNEMSALMIALLSPEPDTLQRMLKRQGASQGPYHSAARCFATGRGRASWPADTDPLSAISHLVLDAELHRRRGQSAPARKLCRQALQQVAALDAAITPHFMLLALLHLQARELPGKAGEASASWLNQRLREGYLCLRPLLDPATGHNTAGRRR